MQESEQSQPSQDPAPIKDSDAERVTGKETDGPQKRDDSTDESNPGAEESSE